MDDLLAQMRGALAVAEIQLEQIVAGAKGEDPEAANALDEVRAAIEAYDALTATEEA